MGAHSKVVDQFVETQEIELQAKISQTLATIGDGDDSMCRGHIGPAGVIDFSYVQKVGA